MKTMQALWLEDGSLRVREDVPVPSPPRGEALVRVTLAGICNTDVELVRGYYPYRGILGHEFVGVVEDGPVAMVGQRVVGEINAVCGECAACKGGRPTHCERRTVLGIVNRDGAFAEYLSLPVENLHEVPEVVSDQEAAFTEPLAAALQIQEQIEVEAGHRVLVVGDGKLGQLVAQTLALTDCDLLVVGRHPTKLRLLESPGISVATVGSSDSAGANTEEPPRASPDAASPAGAPGEVAGDGVEPAPPFDIAVECTGNTEGFALARRMLRPRGTLVMKSTYAGELTFDASSLVVDEITLVGSRCGPFRPALDLLAQGKVSVEPLVDARYSLAEALEAFEHAQRPGVLKVLLEIP